jgi:hypothetical protein
MARARVKPVAPSTQERPAPSPATLGPVFDFGRQWVSVGTEAAGILSRGMQEFNRLQMDAMRDVLGHQAPAAERLQRQPDPIQLLETQVDGMRFAWERSLRCWMDVAGAAAEMQSEMMACGEHLVNTEDVFAAARVMHA